MHAESAAAGHTPYMHSATLPTLRLQGIDRARYFAPVAFFGFLAALCLALITICPFLVTIHDAVAIAAVRNSSLPPRSGGYSGATADGRAGSGSAMNGRGQ